MTKNGEGYRFEPLGEAIWNAFAQAFRIRMPDDLSPNNVLHFLTKKIEAAFPLCQHSYNRS